MNKVLSEVVFATLRDFHLFDENYRALGNPTQVYVRGKNQVEKIIPTWDGRCPVFVSSNGYPYVVTRPYFNSTKEVPLNVSMGAVVFDFDSNKWENAWADTIKLCKYLMEEGIAFAYKCTGGKGFQVHILLKYETWRYWSKEEIDSLKRVLSSIQLTLIDRLDLKTADKAIVGDVKRLVRMPYSVYVNSQGIKNGNYCIPLSHDDLGKPISEILWMAQNPTFERVEPFSGDKLTLTSLFERLNATLAPRTSFAVVRKTNISFEGAAEDFMDLLKGMKPCLYNDAMDPRPTHYGRFSLAAYAKSLSYTEEEFCDIYGRIARKVGYTDYNPDISAGQIRGIWESQYARCGTCWRLKEKGLCLGKDECSRYKPMG